MREAVVDEAEAAKGAGALDRVHRESTERGRGERGREEAALSSPASLLRKLELVNDWDSDILSDLTESYLDLEVVENTARHVELRGQSLSQSSVSSRLFAAVQHSHWQLKLLSSHDQTTCSHTR